MKQNLATTMADIERLQAEAQKKASELFSKEARTLFEQFPMVKSVTWTQYTPFFNDGEECTFRPNCPASDNAYGELNFNGTYEDDPECEAWYKKASAEVYVNNPEYKGWRETPGVRSYVAVKNEDFDPAYKEAEDTFKEFFKQFSTDMYKSLFGDHVQCTLTVDGVETEEYEHE